MDEFELKRFKERTQRLAALWCMNSITGAAPCSACVTAAEVFIKQVTAAHEPQSAATRSVSVA